MNTTHESILLEERSSTIEWKRDLTSIEPILKTYIV